MNNKTISYVLRFKDGGGYFKEIGVNGLYRLVKTDSIIDARLINPKYEPGKSIKDKIDYMYSGCGGYEDCEIVPVEVTIKESPLDVETPPGVHHDYFLDHPEIQ